MAAPTYDTCPTCDGTGTCDSSALTGDDGGRDVTCPLCDGKCIVRLDCDATHPTSGARYMLRPARACDAQWTTPDGAMWTLHGERAPYFWSVSKHWTHGEDAWAVAHFALAAY